MDTKKALLSLFSDGTFENKTEKEIEKYLSLPYRERSRLYDMLSSLVQDGLIFRLSSGRFATKRNPLIVEGVIEGNERGFGFLIADDRKTYPDDFFVPHRNLFGAMHKDKVVAEILSTPQSGSTEASVLFIVERGFTEIVGTFYKNNVQGILVPDDKKYFENIFIPLRLCKNIRDGVKAVARITDYPYKKAPGGEIVEVLGSEDDFEAEEKSVIRSYSLPETFSPRAEQLAETLNRKGITESDLIGREDLRELLTVTIDGDDTRDIDDAVSLEKTKQGYTLGVHIADVSHYVKYGSPLDKEAYERGTSVYFPDRVLPMLPKALSNGICSLNEHADRLAFSCLMDFDENGTLLSGKLTPSVIRSDHKMTYREVESILENDPTVSKKYEDVVPMLLHAKTLTEKLIEKRNRLGMVSLEVKEASVKIDAENKIVIDGSPRPFSMEIIEQFMISANEFVAREAEKRKIPFLYRVHEEPSEEKTGLLRDFANKLSLHPTFDFNPTSKEFALLLDEAKKTSVYPVLNKVMLRSMQKARYSSVNVGHFGLASPSYAHFTSPIRRYPDLCIHRILKEAFTLGEDSVREKYAKIIEEIATDTSALERRAADSERDMDDLYIAMYMSERLGEQFEGTVSSVSQYGVFVELDFGVEGVIPVEKLTGEYEYYPEEYLIKSKDLSFTIGDRVLIKVFDVDFYERKTVFSFLKKSDVEKTSYENHRQ